jgi:hypothetical protein
MVVASTKQTNPEVEFILANTLGVDEHLIDLIVRRIHKAAPELSPHHGFSMTSLDFALSLPR